MKSYIKIIRDESETEEYVADVENKYGQHLGKIYYKAGWRKFIFNFDSDCFCDAFCLNEISNHLKWLDDCKKDGTLVERLTN